MYNAISRLHRGYKSFKKNVTFGVEKIKSYKSYIELHRGYKGCNPFKPHNIGI